MEGKEENSVESSEKDNQGGKGSRLGGLLDAQQMPPVLDQTHHANSHWFQTREDGFSMMLIFPWLIYGSHDFQDGLF
jgi:hypothetical protein